MALGMALQGMKKVSPGLNQTAGGFFYFFFFSETSDLIDAYQL